MNCTNNKMIKKIATGLAAGTLALAMVSCTSPGKKTGVGAGVGAAAGAAVGAIIGHQSGNRGKGALIGAGVGGLLGGGVGNYLDKQAKELAEVAETRRTEHGIVTKLKGDILFPSGSVALKGSGQTNIQKIGQIIKKYPEDILTVIGHTDAQGSSSSNQALSKQRAEAVRAMIIAEGVPPANVVAVGFGESKPVASNDSVDGRAANRRVEIEIRVDETKLKK